LYTTVFNIDNNNTVNLSLSSKSSY